MALVKIEGQEPFHLPDEYANEDNVVRAALATAFPDAASAEIKRETVEGQLVITVVKRAGPKGLRPALAALVAAPPHVNPAVALVHKLEADGPPSLDALLEAQGEIAGAIADGEAELQAVKRALEALIASVPISSAVAPMGF